MLLIRDLARSLFSLAIVAQTSVDQSSSFAKSRRSRLTRRRRLLRSWTSVRSRSSGATGSVRLAPSMTGVIGPFSLVAQRMSPSATLTVARSWVAKLRSNAPSISFRRTRGRGRTLSSPIGSTYIFSSARCERPAITSSFRTSAKISRYSSSVILYTVNTFITSSPKWLMTLTAMRPVDGRGNAREVSLRSDCHASSPISALSVVLRLL